MRSHLVTLSAPAGSITSGMPVSLLTCATAGPSWPQSGPTRKCTFSWSDEAARLVERLVGVAGGVADDDLDLAPAGGVLRLLPEEREARPTMSLPGEASGPVSGGSSADADRAALRLRGSRCAEASRSGKDGERTHGRADGVGLLGMSFLLWWARRGARWKREPLSSALIALYFPSAAGCRRARPTPFHGRGRWTKTCDSAAGATRCAARTNRCSRARALHRRPRAGGRGARRVRAGADRPRRSQVGRYRGRGEDARRPRDLHRCRSRARRHRRDPAGGAPSGSRRQADVRRVDAGARRRARPLRRRAGRDRRRRDGGAGAGRRRGGGARPRRACPPYRTSSARPRPARRRSGTRRRATSASTGRTATRRRWRPRSRSAAHVARVRLLDTRVAPSPRWSRAPRSARGTPRRGRYTLTAGTQGVALVRKMLAESVFKVPPQQDPRADARRRRRLRHEGAGVPGVRRAPLRGAARRPAGEVARLAARELPRRHAPAATACSKASSRSTPTGSSSRCACAPSSASAPTPRPSRRSFATNNTKNCLSSVYVIPAIHIGVKMVLTNAMPLGPYRGAGRPEAIYLIERLIDGRVARDRHRPRDAAPAGT